MTNFEKWRLYTSGLPSPDNFINWAYYYMIAAALQRRVWCPPTHEPIYANMYVTLTGKPGIGKGGPIRAVSSILNYHKLKDANKDLSSTTWTPDEKSLAEDTLQADIKNAQSVGVKGPNAEMTSVAEPLLIPVAADAVTYEALVEYMAKNIRRVNFTRPDGKMGLYSHCSTCFCLEEIASLFRKKTEDVINFLIQAYDCGETYEKRTRTQGNDRILRMCLNFLGGTTPDFMQQAFDDALIHQGYASRTFFIFAAKNRKTVFFRPELTEEQKACHKDLLSHVKKLTKLYGQVQLEQGTEAFLEDWLRHFNDNPDKYNFTSSKLDPFKARMNIHIMKVAMAKHFGETTDMLIRRKTFEETIDFINAEGKTMHMALTMGSMNPLAKTSQKILEYLEVTGRRTFKQLLAQFWEKVSKQQLEEILDYLQMTDAIVAVEEKQKDDTTVMMYKSKIERTNGV